MTTLGDRLRKAREERGWSQPQLAKKSGISQATISDIERGRNAETKKLGQLASAPTLGATSQPGIVSQPQERVSTIDTCKSIA